MNMELSTYFEQTAGFGVMATADANGRVDVAVYSRPHFIDEETITFIMADRLTHSNLTTNPHAAYLFRESGPGYAGKRLYLTRLREEQDSPLIEQMRRSKHGMEDGEQRTRYLVYFHIDKVLPLTGSGEHAAVE
jgi:hypothetical protein